MAYLSLLFCALTHTSYANAAPYDVPDTVTLWANDYAAFDPVTWRLVEIRDAVEVPASLPLDVALPVVAPPIARLDAPSVGSTAETRAALHAAHLALDT